MRTFVISWEVGKNQLAATLHVSHWDLHVIVGVLILLASARMFRRPLTSFSLLVPIAALEGVNEALDFARYKLSDWPWDARSTLIEVALTLGPPLIIIVVARVLRSHGSVASAS